MIGVYLTVPIACFRKGLAREYLETEPIPPPATCYGFLLSLVGEMQRSRHIGCRVSPYMLSCPAQSVVLRTVWRVKATPLGSAGNTRPDYQQLLTGIETVIWLDSSRERSGDGDRLEARVEHALRTPDRVSRFGGLSLGESTHLVNDVCLLDEPLLTRLTGRSVDAFLIHERGRLSLPVWADHVASVKTRYVTGNIEPMSALEPPPPDRMPMIEPLESLP